jgi:uncharacterized membrane protein YhhN
LVPSTPLVVPILVAATLSAALHLRADFRGPPWQAWLFKPLTTVLLLLLAALAHSAHGARYQIAVVLGLACSLLGDVFLMLPKERFIPGLASFLVAHLAYLAAFAAGVPFGSGPLLLVPLLAAAAVLLRVLWPGLAQLRIPVLVYTVAILLMVWSAWERSRAFPSAGATLAAAGALLFMVSDAVLALHRFHRPFRSAQLVIMATYVAAQALISLSVGTP